jgi:hypothetical protein
MCCCTKHVSMQNSWVNFELIVVDTVFMRLWRCWFLCRYARNAICMEQFPLHFVYMTRCLRLSTFPDIVVRKKYISSMNNCVVMVLIALLMCNSNILSLCVSSRSSRKLLLESWSLHTSLRIAFQ